MLDGCTNGCMGTVASLGINLLVKPYVTIQAGVIGYNHAINGFAMPNDEYIKLGIFYGTFTAYSTINNYSKKEEGTVKELLSSGLEASLNSAGYAAFGYVAGMLLGTALK